MPHPCHATCIVDVWVRVWVYVHCQYKLLLIVINWGACHSFCSARKARQQHLSSVQSTVPFRGTQRSHKQRYCWKDESWLTLFPAAWSRACGCQLDTRQTSSHGPPRDCIVGTDQGRWTTSCVCMCCVLSWGACACVNTEHIPTWGLGRVLINGTCQDISGYPGMHTGYCRIL